MANEYRTTLIATEALDTYDPAAIVSAVAVEVSQVDDTVTDIRLSQMAVEVLRTIDDADPGVTHFATLAFTPEGRLTLGSFNLNRTITIAFRGELSFGLHARAKNPVCAAPVVKAWTRVVPPAKAWACVTVVPADECEGVDTSTASDLDYVSGDRLITLDGFGLKLVS